MATRPAASFDCSEQQQMPTANQQNEGATQRVLRGSNVTTATLGDETNGLVSLIGWRASSAAGRWCLNGQYSVSHPLVQASSTSDVRTRQRAPLGKPRKATSQTQRGKTGLAAPSQIHRRTSGIKRSASSEEPASGSGVPDVELVIPSNVRVIDVYTDGSAMRNGNEDARAGYGIHWPASKVACGGQGLQDVSARLPGPRQSSDRAELLAIIRAIQLTSDKEAQLRIFTDCDYCLYVNREGQHKWQAKRWRRGTQTDAKRIPNRDLVERLEYEMKRAKHRPILVHVKGHSGVPGNMIADRLARLGTTLPAVPLDQCTDLGPPPTDDEIVFVAVRKAPSKAA